MCKHFNLKIMQDSGYSTVQGSGTGPKRGVQKNFVKTERNIKRKSPQKYVVFHNDDISRTQRKCLEGKHKLVCLHTMKQWPVSLLLVMGPVLIWSE